MTDALKDGPGPVVADTVVGPGVLTGHATPTAVMPVPVLRLENFLGSANAERLHAFAVAHRPEFVAGDDSEFGRQAAYLPLDSPFLRQALANCLPLARSVLGIQAPGVKVATQITAYGDSAGFAAHTDAGELGFDPVHQLTALYYFHRRPKAFTGGALRLYDVAAREGKAWRAESYREIEPGFDTLLLFPGTAYHEVLPIQCASREFGDYRFAVNAWVS
ncbi:hypothetical protein GCM10010329_77810 [Streptomyces spiroverticillatus]|uniref:Fe2OG dioxygenase domain-containing protein n=1 Tax=Streptomyces finlayi TaxID=67296 RepID=A0A918X5F4_9ACTN|nr:2OG-Fe(II) oxygenase [Streptomyces finlayi]GHA43396.1 hypothetical protein GCM10010329_77810 [Streptomyces spiroverticillatus]GHD13405.1 hypothetical protein GCM10010334_71540 [Streptomyces finlayi]